MSIKIYRCAEHMTGAGRGRAVTIEAPSAELAAERYALAMGYTSLRDMARQHGMLSDIHEFVRALVTET